MVGGSINKRIKYSLEQSIR